jgi:hypothetical protein
MPRTIYMYIAENLIHIFCIYLVSEGNGEINLRKHFRFYVVRRHGDDVFY